MPLTTSSLGSPSQRGVSIIGAGIAGLTLAGYLQKANIKFNIYEARSAHAIGHNYPITLHKTPWKSLANRLGEGPQHLRQMTAADRLVGGSGKLLDDSPKRSSTFQAIDRDVRQWLVQRLQENGVEINWEHKLTSISEAGGDSGASLNFEGRQPIQTDIIVDAGGLRSPAFDHQITSSSPAKLLPYATYYGTRRVAADEFSDRFSHYFRSGNTIQFVPEDATTPFIQIKKVHVSGEDSGNHVVELRWVYSRPARKGSDPLYRPDRSQDEAKIIPKELYEEMQTAMNEKFSSKKRSLLRAFFDSADLHSDRILNWHLRVRLPPFQYFSDNEIRGPYQVIAIGDAAHGLPIVESRGADLAARDAVVFSRWMTAALSNDPRFAHYTNYYHGPSRHNDWFKRAVRAVQRLRYCHGQQAMSQAELQDTLGFWVEGVDVEDASYDLRDLSSSSEADEPTEDKGRL